MGEPLNEDDGWTEELPWLGQYILNENGDAVPAHGLLSWGQWLADHRVECRVGYDVIGNATVSTVFLALDSGWFWREELDPVSYKPTLWETLVRGGPYDGHQKRYTSREDALAGHGKIVQMLTS